MSPATTLDPITDTDCSSVAQFLTTHLNPDVEPEQWLSALRLSWADDAPNHGFMVRSDGEIVGAILSFFSTRDVGGRTVRFCNVGAWCVLEGHRLHSIRLLRAVLAQKGYVFTDLSPSGAVVPLNHRLGYDDLDASTVIAPALPGWRPGSPRLTSDPVAIRAGLSPAEQTTYDDHVAAPAAHHVLITAGDEHCWVVFRRDRRKGRRLFASLLHVSNPDLLSRSLGVFGRHVLLHHHLPFLLLERRFLGSVPWWSRPIQQNRPKMVRQGADQQVRPDEIDYLYSELAAIEW